MLAVPGMKLLLLLIAAISASTVANESDLVHVTESSLAAVTPSNAKPKSVWIEDLRRTLLSGYDKQVRPSADGKSTVVKTSLQLNHASVQEQLSTLSIYGWLKMTWHDANLRWNTTDWGGVSVLHLASHEMWQPDVTLYNSARGPHIDDFGDTYALVYNDGTVLWVPPVKFTVFCALDMWLWPHDHHSCKLVLGSWTYDEYHIDLELGSDSGIQEPSPQSDDEDTRLGGEWRVIGVHAKRNSKVYPCCPEPYIDITFTVDFERRGGAQIVTTEAPAGVLLLLMLTAALLPPTSRPLPYATTAIISTLFLVHLSIRIPAMTERPARMCVVYLSLMFVSVAGAACASLVVRLAALKKPAPAPLARLLTSLKGKPHKAIKHPREEVQDDGVEADGEALAAAARSATDWKRVASLLDILTLVLGASVLLVIFVLIIK